MVESGKQWHTCKKCGKTLSSYQSLWRHKKSCRQSRIIKMDREPSKVVARYEEINVSEKRVRTETKNKQVECRVCLRRMRSDHLKRHMLKHRELHTLDEDEMRGEIKRRKKLQETREEREQLVRQIAEEEGLPSEYCDVVVPDTLRPVSVEKELMDDNLIYNRKIEHGKIICNILENGCVQEDSLSKNNKECLKLYRKQMSMRPLNNVELRLWQQQLKDIIQTPSEREVIWIIGQKGNEGKTWFQEYLETFYGYARVVRLDLKMRTANVLHVLTKRPLSTTDIYLFNEPRAVNNESCNYSILESIKDGTAVSSKYNNDVMRFKIPNVVVVFSNHLPSTKELSKDRWKIFRIVKAGLKDVTLCVWKLQHGDSTAKTMYDEDKD